MKTLNILCLTLFTILLCLVSCNKHEHFTVTVNANDSSMGTVTGGGVYEKNTMATLTAVPNPNYEFVCWKNGSTKNPRTVTVTADASYTAIFDFVGGDEFIVGSIMVTMGDESWEASSFYADAQTLPGKIRFWLHKNEEAEYPQLQGWMDISSTGDVESDLVYMASEDDVDESGMPNWEAVDLTTTLTSLNLDIQNINAEQTGRLRNRTTGEEISLHIEYADATWLNIPEVTRKFVLAK